MFSRVCSPATSLVFTFNSIVSDKGARQSGRLREVVVYGKNQQKEAQTELINVINIKLITLQAKT